MKKIQLLAYFMTLLLIWGCSNKCPDQFGDEEVLEKRQNFKVIYEKEPDNWQPIIGLFGRYPADSIQLYDENYEPVESFGASATGQCNFVYVDIDTPKEEDIIRTYYLYLSYLDTDTIRHEYRVNKNTCKYLLDYGRFFYNNKLITQNEKANFIPSASINK
ncbi:hypothetical protein WAF17_17260 [Bernardetia sp. ABR2-2B]|uniref:hypothetical protein n=1 Tax=Bernardetia sp. ABR2-2B TaxID=3127472 RepID=UPI0030D1BFF0